MLDTKKELIGASIIARAIFDSGIRTVYLFPGGTIAPLLDELISLGVNYVCARNEQGAGYAAIGAAKISGKPQVVLVTSGPGATNLLTPIADAYYDSIPILAITGQVGTNDINFEKKVRQTGFQETDSVSIYKPIVKKSLLIESHNKLYEKIYDSIDLTINGRPGPVLIDLPMDIQRNVYAGKVPDGISVIKNDNIKPPRLDQLIEVINSIRSSIKPLILVGNGIHISEAYSKLVNFVRMTNIPVVSTLPGIGSLNTLHPLHFSFIGHTGEYFANKAFYHSDLIISLGARLDVRQTGTELEHFEEKKLIRIDIDENELLYGRVHGNLNINTSLPIFFEKFSQEWGDNDSLDTSKWIKKISDWKSNFHSSKYYEKLGLSSYHVIKAVDYETQGKRVLVTSGVGTHQQLVPRYFTFESPKRVWMTSAGHGTMGFDLPTAMGALIHDKSYDFGITFVGDGSFQMNIQELATIKNYNLPLKIFVLDNSRLGIVSQFQLFNWEKDESTGKKINPSFSKIANGYGIKSCDIYNKENIPNILKKVFTTNKPEVIHCHVDTKEDVLPMLLGGQTMNEMYPITE